MKPVYREFARNVAISALTDAALKLKGFILIPILTRAIGAIDYGVWALIGVTVSLLTPFSMLGLDNSLTRFLPGKSREEIREDFLSSAFLIAGASSGLALLTWFGADFLAERIFGNVEHALLVRLGAVSLVLSATKDVFKRYYRVFVRMKTYSAFTIAESFGSTLFVAALVLLGYGVKGAILAGIILDGIVLLAASFGVIREIGFSWPKFTNAKTLVSFGLPYVPMAFSIWVAGAADRYFLGAFRGAEEVGIYSVSYSLGYTLAMVVFNPIFLILPSIASRLWNEGKKEEVKELFEHTLQASIFVIAPLLVLAILFSSRIVRLLTTPEFAQGAHNLPIVAFGYGFLMISGFGEIVLSLTKKTTILPLIFGSSAVVNTVLNICLIPPFGATGAATATAATYLLHLIAMVIITSSFLRLDYQPRSLVKIFAASGAMFFLIFTWDTTALWQIAAASFAAFALYVSVTVVLKLPTFSKLGILLGEIR